jgi:hypothetical protein
MSEENTKVEGSATNTSTETTGEATAKTYTEEEVQILLQKEADRRVSSALKKQQKDFENKMAEAERLKTMDEAQRKDYEYNQKLQELEQREKDFAITQNKLEATKVMANRGLPIEFVDYLVADDADTMLENINQFERMFKAAVSDMVAKKISAPSPKNGVTQQSGMTRDDFKKLTISQQAEIYRTNPKLYEQLI